ncbi:aldolase/citrate lyase family protein [Streptomyces canus]|uniref:HpcH/HpaI aldolase/citrate lyase family protein n=1 Tax=Streptomyces canus TaxID=58343 RepID=UPI00225168D8|nr:aldolase/citrate lyase family protein [Streptomyces canus]MCX5256802.1 aldolase/citrate lyase family protein [Streptomyces canus]
MQCSQSLPGNISGTPGQRRSTWLVTPASAPGRFEAAVESGSDVALLDLEDSVPTDGKNAARAAVIGCLSQSRGSVGSGDTVLGVRLNAPGTVHGLRDLVAIAESRARPAVLVVPKVESARDVEIVAKIIDAGDGQRRVWALIETPLGIQRLDAILQTPVLAGVLFGAADYAAAAQCRLNSRALWHPRSVLAAGAAAAGLPAIDSPYFDLLDADGLRREADEAAELGYLGKVAIHPRQLPVIEESFRPTAQELATARAVVAAADAADGEITTVDGHMVGPPLIAAARALTARAGAVTASTTLTEARSE